MKYEEQFIIMQGLPRSGKSTIVREELIPQGYVRVCPDDIRLKLHGSPHNPRQEPLVWMFVEMSIELLLEQGHKVVLDACSVDHWSRKKWFKYNPYFIVVDTSKEVCKSRTEDPGLLDAIERMSHKWSLPEMRILETRTMV